MINLLNLNFNFANLNILISCNDFVFVIFSNLLENYFLMLTSWRKLYDSGKLTYLHKGLIKPDLHFTGQIYHKGLLTYQALNK